MPNKLIRKLKSIQLTIIEDGKPTLFQGTPQETLMVLAKAVQREDLIENLTIGGWPSKLLIEYQKQGLSVDDLRQRNSQWADYFVRLAELEKIDWQTTGYDEVGNAAAYRVLQGRRTGSKTPPLKVRRFMRLHQAVAAQKREIETLKQMARHSHQLAERATEQASAIKSAVGSTFSKLVGRLANETGREVYVILLNYRSSDFAVYLDLDQLVQGIEYELDVTRSRFELRIYSPKHLTPYQSAEYGTPGFMRLLDLISERAKLPIKLSSHANLRPNAIVLPAPTT